MQIFPIILFLIACKLRMSRAFPVGIYLLRRRSGVFITNFEHVSHFFLVFLLLT